MLGGHGKGKNHLRAPTKASIAYRARMEDIVNHSLPIEEWTSSDSSYATGRLSKRT